MKNSNHASKALAVVLSGALAFAPAANAALDESDMAYTSAAEGFYGSLRVQYANNESNGDKNDSKVEANNSRLGVRGDVDLGGGLQAFYGFEWNLGDPADGDTALKTRQNHVGLKGDWGSVWLGAFDSVIVRFGGFSTTDILPQYSGNFEPIYRTKNAIAYISPDLNGFNFGIEAAANDGTHAINNEPHPITDETQSVADDGNDFDKIGVGASYSIQGLTFSGAYYQEQDALVLATSDDVTDTNIAKQLGIFGQELPSAKDAALGQLVKADDKGQYALGIKYKQDNWVVAAMYGGEDVPSVKCVDLEISGSENDQCDRIEGKTGDATFLSLAGGVSIDKLDLHALWEQKTYDDSFQEDDDPATDGGLRSYDREMTIAAISAVYHLGSKASLHAAWQNSETDYSGYDDKTDDTKYALGMRVDF